MCWRQLVCAGPKPKTGGSEGKRGDDERWRATSVDGRIDMRGLCGMMNGNKMTDGVEGCEMRGLVSLRFARRVTASYFHAMDERAGCSVILKLGKRL